MSKCSLVGCNKPAEYAWQPFGPDSSPVGTFTALGYHYRGFPTLKVCQECHDNILSKEPGTPAIMQFTYKGKSYWWNSLKKHFEEALF